MCPRVADEMKTLIRLLLQESLYYQLIEFIEVCPLNFKAWSTLSLKI